MFVRLHIQLTLWYIFALAITLLAVGALVSWLVAQSLDQQINDSLDDASQVAADVLLKDQALNQGGHDSGEEDGEPREDDDEHEENAEGDEYSAAFAEGLLGTTGDVLPLVLDAEGLVIANPRRLPVDELSIETALGAARSTGSQRRDTDVGGHHVRMLTERVVGDDSHVFGYVVTLRSLEQRDEDLQRLFMVLGIGGSVGLVLAAAGGVLVSRLAVRPVRRAFERQREFVADASHELRTPLTVVRANAESLVRKASGSDRGSLEDIVEESRYMGRLISDLLVLAESDSGRLDLSRDPLDLADVVGAAERAARNLAREKGLEIAADADHVMVDGDADRLRELLLILVDNSVRYTPPGGRITIRAKQIGKKAEVVVEDTGAGMEPQHLGRIFDRFYRVDKARARAEGGIGLGLSIAREIAAAHDGTIEAQSEPGRGTAMRVALPAASP